MRLRPRRTVLPLRARVIGGTLLNGGWRFAKRKPYASPPITLMYFFDSLAASMTTPRRWRLRLPVLWLSKCFLPAWRRFSLPSAVTRKRFFEALWVFILGMFAPFVSRRAAAGKRKG